jgi:hypothetical protein
VNVRDVDGFIAPDTVPWRTIDDFESARDALDDWRHSQRRDLKTARDFEDLMKWSAESAARRATGTRSDNRLSPFANAVLKAMAHRIEPAGLILGSPHFPPRQREFGGQGGSSSDCPDRKHDQRNGS